VRKLEQLFCRRNDETKVSSTLRTGSEKERGQAEEAVGKFDARWRSKFAVEIET